jgi:acyl dehydratase
MLDKRLEGSALSPFGVQVDPARLQAFAQATGQTDPQYLDAATARAHGHLDLPIPPTFYFCLEMAAPEPMQLYQRLGVDYARVLHGEQHFQYHRMAFAAERLHFVPRITSLYARKGGALEFIVRDTRVEAANGEPVADLRSVMVVNHALAENCDAQVCRATPSAPYPAPAQTASSTASRRDDRAAMSGPCLPALVSPPVTRETLVNYAAASGDDNPLHIDPAYARQAGHPDVFAHGMLSAAYLARLLTNWVDQAAIRSLQLRFVAITQLGDAVHGQALAHAPGSNVDHPHPGTLVTLNADNQHGQRKVIGTARV